MASADIAAAPVHSGKARVNKHKADWRGWKFMWPFAVVFVFVFIVPIVYAVYISFFKKQMIGGTKFVGFENYVRLLGDGQFWSSVGRVALFTCVQVPIMLCLSALMALALDSMKLHGTKFFRISTFSLTDSSPFGSFSNGSSVTYMSAPGSKEPSRNESYA